MDSNKKVIVAIVVVVLIVGVVIGALAVSNNNSTPTPKPEPEPEPTPTVTTFKCESMELMDSCPYMEKSRQLLLDELQDGLDLPEGYRLFMPYDESDYQWVKVKIRLQYENVDIVKIYSDINNLPTFYAHVEKGTEIFDLKPLDYLRPAYIVNDPEDYSFLHKFDGITEVWYLLPPLTNGHSNIIEWQYVTPSDLHIMLSAMDVGRIPLEC